MSPTRQGQRDPSGTSSAVYSLSRQCLEEIDGALEQLLADCGARCGLVVDRTGVVMASAGVCPNSVGAVAAATMAALNSLVQRASAPEASVRFYGAEVDQIHFMLLNNRLLLCMLYGHDQDSEAIRAAAKVFTDRITPSLQADRGMAHSETATLVESVNYIETKLDQLFKDHLM